MSRADIPIKCTRCRQQCMHSELLAKPVKTPGIAMNQMVCPKCGCKSYYDMSPQVAWCWSSGLIEIGDTLPENESDGSGAIHIAKGPKADLTAVLGVLARNGYCGQLLVPGVPEADTSEAKVVALNAWHAWCAKGNGRKSRHGVEFIKEPS